MAVGGRSRADGPGTAEEAGPTDPRPKLPSPRGPLSEKLADRLRAAPPRHGQAFAPPSATAEGGVLGEDFQLSLYVLYELHYRGFRGVDELWEWQPSLLGLRAALEADFEATLRERVL